MRMTWKSWTATGACEGRGAAVAEVELMDPQIARLFAASL
jgi:hypothetical protein